LSPLLQMLMNTPHTLLSTPTPSSLSTPSCATQAPGTHLPHGLEPVDPLQVPPGVNVRLGAVQAHQGAHQPRQPRRTGGRAQSDGREYAVQHSLGGWGVGWVGVEVGWLLDRLSCCLWRAAGHQSKSVCKRDTNRPKHPRHHQRTQVSLSAMGVPGKRNTITFFGSGWWWWRRWDSVEISECAGKCKLLLLLLLQPTETRPKQQKSTQLTSRMHV